ncbi:MAG: AmmeMemoRadiSam system protein B [Candidatus Delongbacteria bacterium]|jgi:AmmeMemoRadiSam system protein B|nr:AmmeMemoRadiSam system protein B [Candidatus Delongbacteria bacterium]
MLIRKPAVEGSFYPSDKNEVTEMIKSFDLQVKLSYETIISRPKILISPHAGLFFSGLTANYGYKLVSNYQYDRVVIFAPSHRVYFEGMSAAKYDSYSVNGKNITIDTEFTDTISKIFNLEFIEQAHRDEHSAEIQFPFINHYFPGLKISTFVYAGYESHKLSKVINYILSEYKDTLIVISSDLSHFHPYDICREMDEKLIEFVVELDQNKVSQGEACGMIGIKAAVESSIIYDLTAKVLDYRNSGDIIPDKDSVVGYTSIAFY